MKQFLKKSACVLLAAIFAVSIAACGKKDVVAEETETPEIETETEVSHEGMAKSFLTGEWVDEDIAARRPVAIMINNVRPSLPQSNITKAKVVYEINVEGGLTRFMALFEDWDDMDQIGTVRSTRPYYVYLAHEWDPILFHYGQCVFALDLVNSDYIDNVNGVNGEGNVAYYRMSHKSAPNNAYTSADNIRAAIEYMGYDLNASDDFSGPLSFVDDDQTADMSGSTTANTVVTGFTGSESYYEYNAEDGLYYRYQYGSAHLDELEPNDQVSCKNIIIQYITHDYYQGSQYLNINVLGTGSGYYCTDGQCIPITWEKNGYEDNTIFYDQNGNVLNLNQGNTWIHLVPDYRAEYTSIS